MKNTQPYLFDYQLNDYAIDRYTLQESLFYYEFTMTENKKGKSASLNHVFDLIFCQNIVFHCHLADLIDLYNHGKAQNQHFTNTRGNRSSS